MRSMMIGWEGSAGSRFRFEPNRTTYGGGWLVTHPFGTYPPPGTRVKASDGRAEYIVQKEGNLVRVQKRATKAHYSYEG